MNLIFLGPPGVGKGTQAKRIAEEYKLLNIATGDLLREAVKKKSPLGRKAEEIMARGELVPDELVFGLVKEQIGMNPKCQDRRGVLLDGFPRNVYQAEILDQYLKEIGEKINQVVYFQVSEEEIIQRLSARRVCKSCQANYNLLTQPPKKDNVCDYCGSTLTQRADDRPETIRERLKVYQKETAPLVEYYHKQGLLKEINGVGKVEEIHTLLKKLLPYGKNYSKN